MYHATDVAGNAEAEKTFTVNVDTSKPVTSASAASVVRGRTATLKYKVADAAPNAGKATVVIKIKNRCRQGRDDHQGRLEGRQRRALGEVHVHARPRGRTQYYVYATDVAGNAQSKAGSAKLTVR